MASTDEFVCEFCNKPKNTLYDGWFRTPAAFNPFAAGTASAGLLQRRLVCRPCLAHAIETKVACATSLPD